MTDFSALFPEEAVREVIEKVIRKKTHKTDGYDTNWTLLDHNGKELLERKSQACYANLPDDLWNHKKNVKFLRVFQPTNSISEKHAIRWLELCQEAGAIGDTKQFAEDICYRGLLIDLMNPYWTKDKLYITVCNYRFIREGITMVQNIIKLVDKAHVPFWNAFVFSHGHSFSGTGHTWLGWDSSVYASGPCRVHRDNILFIKFLKDNLKNKVDSVESPHYLSEILDRKGMGSSPFRLANRMVTKDIIKVKDRTRMLTAKAVMAIKAETKEEAERIFNE